MKYIINNESDFEIYDIGNIIYSYEDEIEYMKDNDKIEFEWEDDGYVSKVKIFKVSESEVKIYFK